MQGISGSHILGTKTLGAIVGSPVDSSGIAGILEMVGLAEGGKDIIGDFDGG
jgi:hypothetical protein